MFIKTVIKQGEKIIELEKYKQNLEDNYNDLTRRHLNTIDILDYAQEEFLFILDNISELLTNNDYNRPDIKVSKTLEYVKEQIDIIQKDLEINNEPVNDTTSLN